MKQKTYYEEREISCIERLNLIIDELPYYVRQFFIGVELKTSALTRLNYSYDLRVFFDFLSKKIFKNKPINTIELSDLAKLESESSIGKICTISKVIKEDKDILLDVIDFIKRENFVANDRISGSDFIIVLDEEDKERMASLLRHPFNGKYILYDEIKNCVKS